MDNKHNYHFDLPALFRITYLDVRKVARNSLSMKVGEYFSILAKYLKYAPSAVKYLHKIADCEAAESDFRSIEYMIHLLENAGCYGFTSAIEDITSAGKRGHNGFASECANSIISDFSDFNSQLTAAKRTEETNSLPDFQHNDDKTRGNIESQSLKEVLQLLDKDEENRKLRILAVDDAPTVLETISAVLSGEYKVYGMTDPTMLEKFLQQITPELFLLDYKMPERSGFDLVPIIRSFAEHKDTPIIFLTSLGTMEHVSAAFALGACDFIVKPFQKNILCEKVAKHIVRKKLL